MLNLMLGVSNQIGAEVVIFTTAPEFEQMFLDYLKGLNEKYPNIESGAIPPSASPEADRKEPVQEKLSKNSPFLDPELAF